MNGDEDSDNHSLLHLFLMQHPKFAQLYISTRERYDVYHDPEGPSRWDKIKKFHQIHNGIVWQYPWHPVYPTSSCDLTHLPPREEDQAEWWL